MSKEESQEELQEKLRKFLSEGFRSASIVDPLVPDVPGMYCIKLKEGCKLPLRYQSMLDQRSYSILYIGIASESLKKRLLKQELRHRGNGTFLRSLGAVLGFLPPKGSLINKRNQSNYKFDTKDTSQIINWINDNLEVNWIVLGGNLEEIENLLIKNICPLLNIKNNPKMLDELKKDRDKCRDWATSK